MIPIRINYSGETQNGRHVCEPPISSQEMEKRAHRFVVCVFTLIKLIRPGEKKFGLLLDQKRRKVLRKGS